MYTKFALSLLVAVISALPVRSQKFSVSFSPAASKENFSGKVFLYLSKDNKTPKDAMVGVEKFPCFSIAVKGVKPGQQVVFNDASVSYPTPLSDIERGEYFVQAVWDNNAGGRSIATSAGNFFNQPVKISIGKNSGKVFDIVCGETIKPEQFKETEYVKELRAPSALLSGFHKRPTTIDAAVLLPKEYYSQPERKFPVLYWVSGFGADYHFFSGKDDLKSAPIDTTACIRVFLDGNCSLGHSAYANSDNNGPWGDALTRELIPLVESRYRCDAARLLTGHSSGGWTVLWLQTQYPKIFSACWSSSPDPVDFRSFQEINLYSDSSLYYGKDSSLRMAGTIAGRFPWISMKTMYEMENVIYRGEQMHSFDAVFSERNADGNPKYIADTRTGRINRAIVERWKKYDISLFLRTNWAEVSPDLEGKIRVSVGNQDNFLLNYAVHLFEDEMKKVNAGFVFEYYPGDHFTVSTPEYKTAGSKFLQQRYNEMMKHQRH